METLSKNKIWSFKKIDVWLVSLPNILNNNHDIQKYQNWWPNAMDILVPNKNYGTVSFGNY